MATPDTDHERFEELRVAAVQRLGLVDTPPEERFDRITRIAKELFDVPIAEINFIDDQHQFTKSPKPASINRIDSFCEVTVQRPDLVVVPDATKDDRFSWRSPVSDERHIRFYAGRPLSLGDEFRVGTLCLVDTAPRDFSHEQEQLLDEMGAWVERELKDTLDLDRAAEVQQLLLPEGQPSWPSYDVAGLSLPKKTVGGDFYSWHGTGEQIELTLADVMGKGTAGAIVAAAVRSAFQSRSGLHVAAAVDAANAQLAGDLDRIGSFATLFHGVIDVATGRLDYADAGHGLTLVVHPDGSSERLAATGLPLGIVADARWGVGSVELAPGDRLVTFTDGVLDLYDGTIDCLPEVAALVAEASDADDVLRRLQQLITTRQPDDDVTMVVVTRAAP
ncbi:SpoIIE family protein phosphatase [Herbiconiux moechotypicola]|uniref:Protein phosphatase n=1 Tax=Herbiconiux moechotypicola TaxID=637393 RepID=A0ABN3DDZ3_9MICO|nr:SpoIIE family protein phosphatase [Herbiconiux moechotypicola]MCS5729197.1 SpoIIE family protein phosphatase [Herbiconiux moechotypicola]